MVFYQGILFYFKIAVNVALILTILYDGRMKKCGSCKSLKPKTEFYKNSTKKDGISSYCKKCNTLWVRKRYLKNKKYYDDKNKEARLRNQLYIYSFLRENHCVDCGEKNPILLEFDHISEKKMCVSEMVRKLHALDSIKKEISKCEVRCCNCHRIKTAKQLGWYKFLEDFIPG